MVHAHSSRHPVDAENGSRVSEVGDIASASRWLFSDKDQAAGASGIAGADQFELFVSFGEGASDDCLDVSLLVIELILEDLPIFLDTLGMTCEQYSETWLPPCPSKMPKSPEPLPAKLSWHMETRLDEGYSLPCLVARGSFCPRGSPPP